MLAVLRARIITWKLGVLDPSRYCETHLRIDAFLAGVLLAYFYHYRRENLMRWMAGRRGWVALAGLVLVCPCLLRDVAHPAMLTFGYTSLYLGFALILLAILTGVGTPGASAGGTTALAPLGFIVLYSYSIYLWHVPIRRWMPPAFGRLLDGTLPGWLEIGLYLVGSVVVGCLMARLIELPFLHFRDRRFPSAARPTAVAGSLITSAETPLNASVPE